MFTLLVVSVSVLGASDPRIDDLALCRDSWLDWKNTDSAALASFGVYLRSAFAHSDNDSFFTPKSPMTINGLTVSQVFPGSLGMGLGFSVIIDAPFDVTKEVVERDLGKPFRDCQASDGMRTCELSIADQRTVMLASNDPPSNQTTLVGCYYFYEK